MEDGPQGISLPSKWNSSDVAWLVPLCSGVVAAGLALFIPLICGVFVKEPFGVGRRLTETPPFSELAYWCASASAMLIFLAAAFLLSLDAIWRSLAHVRLRRAIVLGVGLVGLLSAAAHSWLSNFNPRFMEQLLEVLQPEMRISIRVLVGLTFALAVWVTAAGCSVLVWQPTGKLTDADELSIREAQVLRILYACALLLVAGVIQLHWSYHLVSSGDTAHEVGAVAAALGGGFFSALLLGGYLPTIFLLRHRLLGVVEREGLSTAERVKWLKASGLHVTPLQTLTRSLAVLGPMMMGLLARALGSD